MEISLDYLDGEVKTFPKTGYTYADSGSYRLDDAEQPLPNMSRMRLRSSMKLMSSNNSHMSEESKSQNYLSYFTSIVKNKKQTSSKRESIVTKSVRNKETYEIDQNHQRKQSRGRKSTTLLTLKDQNVEENVHDVHEIPHLYGLDSPLPPAPVQPLTLQEAHSSSWKLPFIWIIPLSILCLLAGYLLSFLYSPPLLTANDTQTILFALQSQLKEHDTAIQQLQAADATLLQQIQLIVQQYASMDEKIIGLQKEVKEKMEESMSQWTKVEGSLLEWKTSTDELMSQFYANDFHKMVTDVTAMESVLSKFQHRLELMDTNFILLNSSIFDIYERIEQEKSQLELQVKHLEEFLMKTQSSNRNLVAKDDVLKDLFSLQNRLAVVESAQKGWDNLLESVQKMNKSIRHLQDGMTVFESRWATDRENLLQEALTLTINKTLDSTKQMVVDTMKETTPSKDLTPEQIEEIISKAMNEQPAVSLDSLLVHSSTSVKENFYHELTALVLQEMSRRKNVSQSSLHNDWSSLYQDPQFQIVVQSICQEWFSKFQSSQENYLHDQIRNVLIIHGILKSGQNLNNCSGEVCQGTLSRDNADIRKIIQEALNLYSADRLAEPDYALESIGGSVIGTKCTKTYTEKPTYISVFGFRLFSFYRSPRTIIQPSVHPGECYAFHGSYGQLVIQLAMEINITGVTLEHIPKAISPTKSIDSAPKKFAIKGLLSADDNMGVLLGEFTYLDDSTPMQSFDILPIGSSFRYVELEILSNHGHPDYTCVYRLRVHGFPITN